MRLPKSRRSHARTSTTPALVVIALSTFAAVATPAPTAVPSVVPPLEHVIVVIMENKSYDVARVQPYTAGLIKRGVAFTHSFAVTHPSQPNYMALWAGDLLVLDNTCPAPGTPLHAENLGHACEQAGIEWRAYSDDPLAAELLGVSPVAVAARAFALSGALAGLAGATMTAAYGAVGYGLSGTLTLKALAAAIVGGIGSLPGAFLGGLIVGAAEAGWSALFPIDDRDLAVYALLIVFIALRPSGLLGPRDDLTGNLFPRRS